MVHLEIYIEDEYLTKVAGDGLIISTSTGSTAYSLSAGGTIVHYDVDTLILNAICPHSLSFRPIAFPHGIKLKFRVSNDSKTAYVNCDGINLIERKPGQSIVVRLSNIEVGIILLEKFTDSPVKVWKKKLVEQLGWNKGFVNI